LSYFVSLPFSLLSLTGFFANLNEGNGVFSNNTFQPHDIFGYTPGLSPGESLVLCAGEKFLITQLLREIGGCCELGTIFDCM
jgi:hypothetical protein